MTSNFPTLYTMTHGLTGSRTYDFREHKYRGMFPAGAALAVLEMFLVLLSIVHGGKLCFAGRGLAITSRGHLRPRNRLGMVGEGKNRGGLFDEEDAMDE
jgi:hypothetical protein